MSHKLLKVMQPRRNKVIMFWNDRVMNRSCTILRNYFNIFSQEWVSSSRDPLPGPTNEDTNQILTTQPTNQLAAVTRTHLSRSNEYTDKKNLC